MRTTVLEEQELEFEFNSTYGAYVNESNPSLFLPVVGKTYFINWDGVEYECLAFTNEAFENQVMLGNGLYAGIGENTGEPFFMSSTSDGVGMTIFTLETSPAHTIGISINEEAAKGISIVLYNRTGEAVIHENVETLTTDTPVDGEYATFTHGVLVEGTEIELDMADGNQELSVPDGYLIKNAVIKKPKTLLPENIKKDVEIAGIVGNLVTDTVEKTVELNMADGNQIVSADENVPMSKVTITKPDTLIPENIASGVDIGGVVGNYVDEFELYANGENGRVWSAPKNIPAKAFYSNEFFTDESFPNVLTVGSSAFYSAKVTGIDLPQCTKIDTNAFAYCSSLISLNSPQCSSIGTAAFLNCINLKAPSLPNVKMIGSNAFANARSIEEIDLPNCDSIGNMAFMNCSKLKTASIPACTALTASMFHSCQSLETIYAPKCTFAYNGVANNSTLCNITLGALTLSSTIFYSIAKNKVLTINGSPIIAQSAFISCGMSGLSLLGFSSIYPYAFPLCPNLKQIYTPITLFWTTQFYGCSNLIRVIASKNARIGQSVFANCSSLKYFSGYAISYISSSAFYGCSNLSVIAFTSYRSLTQAIGSYAFSGTPIVSSGYLGYFGSIYVPESYLASYQADSYWASYSARFAPLTSEILSLCEWEDL